MQGRIINTTKEVQPVIEFIDVDMGYNHMRYMKFKRATEDFTFNFETVKSSKMYLADYIFEKIGENQYNIYKNNEGKRDIIVSEDFITAQVLRSRNVLVVENIMDFSARTLLYSNF